MTIHLLNALEDLKKKFLIVAVITEEQLDAALRALETRDERLAGIVVEKDNEVDRLEVEVEEECLKTLALFQPVSFDLRLIIAILKINNDIERIADLAANIAERALALSAFSDLQVIDIKRMGKLAKEMVRLSIDCFVKGDAALAMKVCLEDKELNAIHRDNFDKIREAIVRKPELGQGYIGLLSVSRYLERISDQATNIAEDIIYLVEGRIVRHRKIG